MDWLCFGGSSGGCRRGINGWIARCLSNPISKSLNGFFLIFTIHNFICLLFLVLLILKWSGNGNPRVSPIVSGNPVYRIAKPIGLPEYTNNASW
jgi:hypothetical protein